MGMWAESKGLGQGSTFHCTLKSHARQSNSTRNNHNKISPAVKDLPDTQSTDKSYKNLLDGKACLLIEENDTVRESLAKAMRSWGLKVTPFSSEQSALAYLIWPDSHGKKVNIFLDFVIIDKDCRELTKALVEQKRDISIVFIVWPSADEINGIGDTSKNLLTPMENDLGSLLHLCVQRPVRHGRLKNALEELCSTKSQLALTKDPPAEKKEVPCPSLVSDLEEKQCSILIAEDNVIDMHMPRKGGMEVVKELKEKYGDVENCKIVAVTADAFAETRERCFDQGFTHWIAKPFRIKDIEQIFESNSSDHS